MREYSIRLLFSGCQSTSGLSRKYIKAFRGDFAVRRKLAPPKKNSYSINLEGNPRYEEESDQPALHQISDDHQAEGEFEGDSESEVGFLGLMTDGVHADQPAQSATGQAQPQQSSLRNPGFPFLRPLFIDDEETQGHKIDDKQVNPQNLMIPMPHSLNQLAEAKAGRTINVQQNKNPDDDHFQGKEEDGHIVFGDLPRPNQEGDKKSQASPSHRSQTGESEAYFFALTSFTFRPDDQRGDRVSQERQGVHRDQVNLEAVQTQKSMHSQKSPLQEVEANSHGYVPLGQIR